MCRLGAALEQPFPNRLQFVLGTESGMITSIVRKVQGMLRAAGRDDVEVEVVFPVSPEAITTDRQQQQVRAGVRCVCGWVGGSWAWAAEAA